MSSIKKLRPKMEAWEGMNSYKDFTSRTTSSHSSLRDEETRPKTQPETT